MDHSSDNIYLLPATPQEFDHESLWLDEYLEEGVETERAHVIAAVEQLIDMKIDYEELTNLTPEQLQCLIEVMSNMRRVIVTLQESFSTEPTLQVLEGYYIKLVNYGYSDELMDKWAHGPLATQLDSQQAVFAKRLVVEHAENPYIAVDSGIEPIINTFPQLRKSIEYLLSLELSDRHTVSGMLHEVALELFWPEDDDDDDQRGDIADDDGSPPVLPDQRIRKGRWPAHRKILRSTRQIQPV